MWEKIRKITLCAAVFGAVITALLLIETGKFDSPVGFLLYVIDFAYLGLFTFANFR